MRRVSFEGTLHYFGILLIAMQGVLLALLALLMLNNAYQAQWREYGKGKNSVTVYLDNLSEERSYEVEQYLFWLAENDGLFLIRCDSTLGNDGSFEGYTFGVYGNVEHKAVGLDFYGSKVMDGEMLSMLMQSEEEKATLGIEKGSVYSLMGIPVIRFGEPVVFKKLHALIEGSGTVQGEYVLVGDGDCDWQAALSGLAGACGVSEEQLLKPMNGTVTDGSFRIEISIVFILSQIFLNAVFFVIIALRNLDKAGKLALLGWSRGAFCYTLFGRFLWYAVIGVPILTAFGTLWSGWHSPSGAFMSHFFLYAVGNLLLTVLEVGAAAMILMTVSPLAAIRGRFPKKMLYFLGTVAYLGVSAGICFCGVYVDGPVKQISENASLSKMWSSVSEYQVLKSLAVGEDEGSFAGRSKQLDQDLFDWYRAIHKRDGVYLVKTNYYDEELLDFWKENGLYAAVPQEAFWYFAVSESYLREIGLSVDQKLIEAAESGSRIYLIPEQFSPEQKSAMQLWLSEFCVRGIREGDIDTVFNGEQNIVFEEYECDQELFTWASESTQDLTSCMPVIYLCTPENMTYFESESLRAVGLDGYLKFKNEQISRECLQLVPEFGLEDNQLCFLNVQNYMDGIQKELMNTIQWFGMVFLILGAILIGILLALATVFRIANQEKLHVQKFLGYGFGDMYSRPAWMLGIVSLTEIVTMWRLGSKFGVLVVCLLAVAEGFIFARYMIKNEISSLCTAFKER